MSEPVEGQTVTRAITRFTWWFVVVAVIVAAVLVTTGHWPGAVGVLVSPIAVGAVAVRFRRLVRTTELKNTPPSGMTILATVCAVPGVIIIFVGYLIGGGGITFFCTAFGSSLIGVYGLMIALARSLTTKERRTTT